MEMMSEALRNKGRARNRLLALAVALFTLSVTASAQRNTGRLSLGTGLLYRNGMDVTLAYEHEMNYHNAWEFFANGYLPHREAATRRSSLQDCISATNTTMCCGRDGCSSGR